MRAVRMIVNLVTQILIVTAGVIFALMLMAAK